jgi:hypothetical protein
MSQRLLQKLTHVITPHLESGESLLNVASANPVKGASALGIPGPGRALGVAIARIGAVKGGAGSIAETFPYDLPVAYLRLLAVTSGRVLFLTVDPARKHAELLWHIPRDKVTGIEKKPRLQIMAKFALHFSDESSVSLLTFRQGTVASLAEILGWWQ